MSINLLELMENSALEALKLHREVKIKKLKMKPNFNLKLSEVKIEENISILTLNVNKIKNKFEELDFHLRRSRPSIICLQETGRQINNKKIHINGYSVDEVLKSENGLGLLIGIRKDTNLIPKVLQKDNNFILFSVKNQTTKILIANVYKHNGSFKKRTKEKIMQALDKYKSNINYSGIILVGDWNSTPEHVLKEFSKNGMSIYATKVPTKGTRYRKKPKKNQKSY